MATPDTIPLPAGLTGLTADSRKVRPGFLFAALPSSRAGSPFDGRNFIPEALAQGAVAILAPEGTSLPAGSAATLILAPNPRQAFSRFAAAFWRHQPGMIAAVTGTSGKTSTVAFLRQLWSMLGHRAASLGTLGLVAPTRSRYGALTTPDPVDLHADLAALAEEGVTHLAMEASSHGLEQYRLDGVNVRVAAFTNLSRDHLDYHPTVEAYLAAKARLFDEILDPSGIAVVTIDGPEGRSIAEHARRAGRYVITCGRAEDAEVRLAAARPTADGLDLAIVAGGTTQRVALPLMGPFQADNAVCAAALAIASGERAGAVLPLLARLEGVPGRMQLAARRASGAPVFVDYAHKPGALEAVLLALRPHTAGRLAVVFGCGGDRDPGKRPMMGEIATRLADRVIVTDDNPRSEEPAAIRRAILAAAPGAEEFDDRAAAIRAGVDGLGPDDVLVVAGKGHETGQIVRGEVRPFDDVEETIAAVRESDGKQAATRKPTR
jgi:UDP-N-acetylmuramoyl-L-alanyl-D-glutamate--2,6-diaminopimelate ligase